MADNKENIIDEFEEELEGGKKEKKHPYMGIVFLMVLTILALSTSIVAYVAASSYNNAVAAAAPFSAPNSGLSQSLFVAQNSEYVENAKYPLTYNFGTIPYICSVPRLQYINMGNGVVMNSNGDFFLYITECDNDAIISTCIEELSPAIMSSADPEKTEITSYGTDRGYFNGFDVAYMAQEMVVNNADGSRKNTVYTLSYVFPVENMNRSAVLTVVFPGKRDGERFMNVLKEWGKTYRMVEETESEE